MPIALGVGIGYHLTHIVHYAMSVTGFGLTTGILITLSTTVIPAVGKLLRQQKKSLYAIRVTKGLDEL